MMKGVVAAALCMVIVAAALQVDETAAAVTCTPKELKPCGPALSSGENPTAECCSNLKEHKPCLCTYIVDPEFRPYIRNPTNVKNVLTYCGIPIPICPIP